MGYGPAKLASVMRDTLVEIPDHGRGKLNAAFAYGGAEMLMRTLNQNFGLNIMHYAQVDFVALVKVVDAAIRADVFNYMGITEDSVYETALDEKVDDLLLSVRKLDRRNEEVGIRAFVWNIEQMV